MQDYFKLSFKQLMLSNVFLGSRKDSFNMIMKPFILGYRGSFCILNLSHTYIQFKLIIHILFNIVFLRKKVLMVKENDLYDFKISLEAKNLYFYNKKWIGGCLTNFKTVSRHPKFLELSKSFSNLRKLKYLPSFIFLFDPNISEAALFEGYVLGIPTSAIVNSDCLFFESINYPIVGNTECYESMYFYMYVLRDAIKLGLKKEYIKILRIKKLKSNLKIRLRIRRRKKKYKFLC